MELKLLHISVEGFGSIHDRLEFKLDRPGFNIIQAKNGSGKSSILAAICWVLWGKAIKDKATSISTWPHLRGKSYKGTMVSISLLSSGVPYTIIRCKDYKDLLDNPKVKGNNGLYIIKDGVYQSKERDKEDVKKDLKDIVGYSLDLFKNSVAFGQKASRIISESGPRQKEILEQAFEVGYINKAHELEKGNLKIIHKEWVGEVMKMQKLEAELESLKKIITLTREKKASFETHKEEKVRLLQSTVDKLNEQLRNKVREIKASKGIKSGIQALESKLAIYTNAKNEYKLLENQEFKLTNEIGMLESQAELLIRNQQDINNRIAQKARTCDACGQPLNKENRSAQMERYKETYNKLKKEYLNLTVEIGEKVKLQKSLLTGMKEQSDKFSDANQYEKQLNKLKLQYKPIKQLKADLELLEENIFQAEEEVNTALAERNPVKVKPLIEERMALKEKLHAQKQITKKLKKKVDIGEWLINDALSNKGLKAYIFNSMLGAINKRLAKYARYIGFKAVISIDMASANKNVTIKVFSDENEVSVGDLSGGQCQLIDIVIAFSIHDVVSMDKMCNILFMDEVFESLDEENVELVTELIKVKSKGLTLFLITHLTNFNVTGSNIIRLALNKKKHTIITS